MRLPSAAPTNNTKIVLHLGGTTDYEGDYLLTKPTGAYVTNDLFFAMGEREIRLQVNVVNDTEQSSQRRVVSVALAESANYPLDPQRADVTLVDNDLPTVSVVANDLKAEEPKGTNTNPGAFVIRRDGLLTNALTVLFSVSGSATAGSDYTNFTSPVVMPVGSNVVTVPVNPIHDTNYEGNETVVLTLQSSASYVIDAQAPTGLVTIADDDLPLVYLVGTDLVATEYNSQKAATVTLRRTGNPSQPLTVPIAISGTAVNSNDYQFLTNVFTFPAGASNVAFNVRPIADTTNEQAETVILVLKGSHSYNIGPSNSVTVFIDDDFPTRYEVAQPKQSSAYHPAYGIDAPSVIEIRRFGRSSNAVSLPFIVQTNTAQGPQPTTFYRVYGDVSGQNASLPPFATKARLNFTAPVSVSQAGGGVDVRVPSTNAFVQSVFFQPAWQYLRFSIIETNVIEGGVVQGRVRLTRSVTGPVPMSARIDVSGHATTAGLGGADHTLSSFFFMNLAANALSVDTTFTASTDAEVEGWESIVFTPYQNDIQIVFDPLVRYMGFVRENAPNAELLPEGDFDLDGLGDRYELANGFDPFTPGEELLDPDQDGLTNVDEFQSNTNPNDGDSDNDGEADFSDTNRPANVDDFLEVRLVTRDIGKVNNGNCAKCHTTRLRVGDFSLFSRKHGDFAERSFWFRKGTNYPIHLSKFVRNLPPPTQNQTSPSTTWQYTAGILPAVGAPAAFIVQDPQTKLGTNKPPSAFPADATASIGTLIVPKIDVTWTNLPGNLALDANTNWGGGLRMFPDALSPTDLTPRNTVTVVVKSTPPLPGQNVRVKSFDVDDPTPPDMNTHGVVDPNDVFQLPGGDDNRGTPLAGQLAQTTLTLDSQGKASTTFTVTMQPGNNFRVAAVLDTGPEAVAHLNSLQVDSDAGFYYVSPDTNAVFGFVGGTSPMLTVWRKLHLEFDSMTAPPSSGFDTLYLNGSVTGARLNYPAAGHSQIKLYHVNDGPGKNLFQQGKLEIQGIGTFKVLNSGTIAINRDAASTLVEILGVPSGVIVGSPVKLFDDDDRFLTNDVLYSSILNLQSPPLPMDFRSGEFTWTNQARFAPAYIQLVDVNTLGWNTQPIVPFQRRAEALLFGGVFDSGNQQLKGADRPGFWAYTVIFGYQSVSKEDGEPDDEPSLDGITVKKGLAPYGYSVVYLEAIRDQTFAFVPATSFTSPIPANGLRQSYMDEIYTTIAHEIGHAPGDTFEYQDHAEGDLMKKNANNAARLPFSPRTIKRFRGATKWAE